MRTRPSFTNFPISLHASDLATSKTRSPFCSVQTLTAMSPLPIGMESFSLVPRVDQVTSFGATNSSKTLCSAAAERQIRKNAKSAICDFTVLITKVWLLFQISDQIHQQAACDWIALAGFEIQLTGDQTSFADSQFWRETKFPRRSVSGC